MLDSIAIFLTSDWFLICLAVGFLVWLYLRPRMQARINLAIVSALISRGVIVEFLKRVIDRQRPYEALTNIHQLFADTEKGLSFPSGHTVIFFSVAFAFFGARYFWWFLGLAFLASVARVFAGVHYPADILASILIAGLTVWATRKIWERYK